MTLKFKALIILFFLLGGINGNCQVDELAEKDNKPNVIFIFIDDLGYGDLSSYGNCKIETPNIDRLANEGMRFTNFYVGSPICSPSRVAVLTGQYPARHGITSFLAGRERNEKRNMNNYLSPQAPSIARAVKKGGYSTAHFGKWHMGGGRNVADAPKPEAYGFDESLVSFEGLGDRLLIKGEGLSEQSSKLGQGKIQWVEKHEITPILVDRTIDFLKRNKDKPFYINLWPGDVHDPLKPKADHRNLFNEFGNNHYEQEFMAVLYQLDLEIGRLLDELDKMGLTDETLIIFSSDNGPTDWKFYYEENFQPPGSAGPFRGRKWSLYEGGIREPFIVRWPDKISAGIVNDTTILHSMDLFPTLMQLLGIERPAVAFDGEDMSQAIMGDNISRTKPIFWEYGGEFNISPGNPRFVSPTLAMRQGKWKLLINEDGSRMELYNLQTDKPETSNVAEKNSKIAASMSRKVLEWKRDLP